MGHVPGSLRALLSNLIDYAGLFPPAALGLDAVVANYERYLASDESWILGRLVLPAGKQQEIRLREGWHVTLLVEAEPGPLPVQVETLETKGVSRLSLPTYCEAPLESIGNGFAKVRTGGLTPDAIPSAETLADFLCTAAAARRPFKATAGLHHPIRSAHALTYAPDSPCATMHGFLNVFIAAAFAWGGEERGLILDVLNEGEAGSFEFGEDEIRWRGQGLGTEAIEAARREFAHSFGSCSFEEPVEDLRTLGFLSVDKTKA